MRGALLQRKGDTLSALDCYLRGLTLAYSAASLPPTDPLSEEIRETTIKHLLQTVSESIDTPEDCLLDLAQMKALTAMWHTKPLLSQQIASELSRLRAKQELLIDKRECIKMASDLNAAASSLEKNGAFAMAKKLMKQALKIDEKTFGENAPETAIQLTELARSAVQQQHYDEADPLYKKAVAILDSNAHANLQDKIAVLESYAQMLEASNNKTEADKIYARAIKLHRLREQDRPNGQQP